MSDLDDILLEGETVIWQDRPAGPGTRRHASVAKRAADYLLPAIILVFTCLALCLWVLIVTDLLPRLAVGAFTIAFVAMAVWIAIGAVRAHRERVRSEYHYVLTNQRLIAWDAASDWRVHVLPGALKAVVRERGNLQLYLHGDDEDDDPLILYDLADIDTAERTITQALGRPS